MKGLLTIAFAVALISSSRAKDYYVSADTGNDGWDGTAAVHEDGTDHGPRKTLVGAMAIKGLAPYDTVHVAPGTYDSGEAWDKSCSNRLYVTIANLAIVADGGRDVTFIEGRYSQTNTAGRLGIDAVRCVKITGEGSYVKGFTIRNGATSSSQNLAAFGGGCIQGGTAIDCNIYGGASNERGNNAYNTTCIGCYLHSAAGGAEARTAYDCNCYNCVASGMVYAVGIMVNSSFFGYVGPMGRGADNRIRLYNCYLAGSQQKNIDCYHCYFAPQNPWNGNSTHDDECVPDVPDVNAGTRTLPSGSLLIDKGRNDYYADYFPSEFKEPFGGADASGRPRVLNGAIDVGALEYDWRADFTKAVSHSKFIAVSDCSPAVGLEGTDALGIPAGSSVTLSCECPSAEIGPAQYAMSVLVSGSGVLEIRLDDSEVPFRTVSAEDGQTVVAYEHDAAHTVRLVMTGEGSAVLSDVSTTAHVVYFVDADHGDDEKDGRTRKSAKRTLCAVMSLAESGDVVHAARGTYAEGEAFEGGTSNRVVVGAGVGLVADEGADVTAIEGFVSPTGEESSGCGEDAVRCAYIGAGGYLQGFTLRNGRTRMYAGTATDAHRGGGVMGDSAAVVDCVISNCACAHYGGGAYGSGNTAFIRCRFSGNVARQSMGVSVYQGALFDSFIDSGDMYVDGPVVNCYLRYCRVRGSKKGMGVYNTACTAADYKNCRLYRCLFGGSLTTDSEKFDGTEMDLGRDVVAGMFDGNGCAIYGKKAVDFGDANHYRTNFPAAWARFEEDLDVRRGQRIYNGAIDAGCGECDYRERFGETIGGRRVQFEVTAASEDVRLLKSHAVLSNGCAMTVFCPPRGRQSDLRLSLTLEGMGKAKVSLNGESLAVAESTGTVLIPKARASDDGDRITIVYEGAGSAYLDRISFNDGLLMIFR